MFLQEEAIIHISLHRTHQCHGQHAAAASPGNTSWELTLTVPVTTIDALGHFETG